MSPEQENPIATLNLEGLERGEIERKLANASGDPVSTHLLEAALAALDRSEGSTQEAWELTLSIKQTDW